MTPYSIFVLFLRRMDLSLIENHFWKKENKITKELNVFTDTVVSIVIMKDILTDEEFYMYKLKNKNYLFNEKTLMKQYY